MRGRFALAEPMPPGHATREEQATKLKADDILNVSTSVIIANAALTFESVRLVAVR